jgi:sulfonate transport system substrate-binding protein
MEKLSRRSLLLGGAGLSLGALTLAASGCRPGPGSLASSNASTNTRSRGTLAHLRIGYQKGGALNVLRLRGDLDRRLAREGVTVEWLNFPAGPQLLEALGVGSVDLGATGDAPAIFAQAAGIPIAYVANTPPGDGDSRAILVPKDSPIKSVAQLRGKRVAVQKGSGTHNFLVQALDRAGIPYESVQVRYLAPAEARAAFDAGSVDAWAIWDPFLAVAQKTTGARALVNGAGIVSAGGFYLSSREYARTHPDLLRAALEEVDRAGVWASKHPREAAELLSPSIGVDVATLELNWRRAAKGDSGVGYRPIDAEVVAAQQKVADIFLRIRLLPKRVDVRAGLLTPAEYAAITPAAGSAAKVAKAGEKEAL